jgi:hypothetical protein
MKSFSCLAVCILFAFACYIPVTAQSNANNTNAQNSEHIYLNKELTQKAVVRDKPHPKLSKKSIKSISKYTNHPMIRLRVILRSNGEVSDIEVKKVLPENLPDDLIQALTEATTQAARKLKFTPAVKDGRSVSTYVILEYVFNFF